MPALMTNNPEVVLGVDTHLDAHVGALLSETGKLLGTLVIPVRTEGYQHLLAWAMSYGDLRRADVEGTGTYGAELTRVLRKHGVEVVEINRPDRAARRSQGKSDPDSSSSGRCSRKAR